MAPTLRGVHRDQHGRRRIDNNDALEPGKEEGRDPQPPQRRRAPKGRQQPGSVLNLIRVVGDAPTLVAVVARVFPEMPMLPARPVQP